MAGVGNTITAEFWMYDARLGRRWNLDPKSIPEISGYACFKNNPLYFTDLKGDSGEYYYSKGNFLMKSTDNLPNAAIVIPDGQLHRFNYIKGVIERNTKSPKAVLNSDKANKKLRSLGMTYLIDDMFKFYDNNETDVHDGSVSKPRDGKGPFINENAAAVNFIDGVMSIGAKGDYGHPNGSYPPYGKVSMHTHPNEGRLGFLTSNGKKFTNKSGNEAHEDDIDGTRQRPGTGYLDIGVTKTAIRLYNSSGVVIQLTRGQMFK
ncbi:MAG: hypothetical protein Q8R57_01405 [Bacteroidota bacterium]|nr:hypothetical protein [Bacteroidota bacterium]